jgi:hypothetical protein
MVPFTRTVGAGCAEAIAHDAAINPAAHVIFTSVDMKPSQKETRRRKPAAR